MDKKNLLMFHRLSMDLFCVLDKQGKIVDINESFLKQLDWQKNEVLGKSLLKFIAKKDHKNLFLLYEKLKHNQDVEEFDCHLLKSSGEEQSYRSNSFFDEKSECFYITSILSQLTPDFSAKEITHSYDEDHDILSEIQSIAKIGSWEYDFVTDKGNWSTQMYKLFGVDPKKGVPKPLELKEFIFKDDYELWSLTMDKILRDGEPYFMTYRVVNPFQGIIWLESRGRGFFDEAGEKIVKLRGTIQDVTYLKLKESRLQVAIKETQKLSHSKDLFLANMSHEIRTPMNGILGMTELLLNSNITEEQNSYLKIIKNSGQSLLEIINDILDLSKVESGLSKVNKKEFELKEMMNNLYHLFLNLAQAKKIKLSLDIDPNISTHLNGDEMKLRQILTNLIGNALKFTLKGEVRILAELVDVHEKHLFIRFRVKDTGFGIDQAQVGDSIFKPFVQENRESEMHFGGTGLGLSISAQLLELMGSSLDYKSEAGKGAEFWFTLGFDIALKKPMKLKNEPKIKLEKNLDLKVLVVEDNNVNRLIISKFLQRLGLNCDEANNGEEALKKIKNKKYDLVFMDLKMPKLSGFETTEKIQMMKLNQPPKIVAITANAYEEDKQRCFELGMYDFLTKPISFDQFSNLIKKVDDSKNL